MIASHLHASALLGHLQPGPPEPAYQLGPVGKCPTRTTLLITIADDSGSVTSPHGADPIAQRYTEMDHALTAVAEACNCGQELAAIVHFDTPAGDRGPSHLTHRGLRRLRPGLTAPKGSAGSSDLLPALTKATSLAQEHPNDDIVLMIFSDFCLTDPDPTAVLDALENFPGLVYACLLGGDANTSIPGTDFTVHIGETRQNGDVARALMTGLTLHRGVGTNTTTPHAKPTAARNAPNH